MVARATSAVIFLAVAACGAGRTDLIVLTDTDLAVPSRGNLIRVDVTGPSPGAPTQTAEADLSDDPHLPRTTTLAWDDGPLGPFIVHATLFHDHMMVVQRTARVSFVPGREMLVRLDLLASCAGTPCSPVSTCGAHGCEPIDVAPADLEPWTGEIP